MKKNKFMKTSEAAKYLGVSRSSITNWIRNGELSAASTPGGHYLFSKEQLDLFADERGMILNNESSHYGIYRVLVIDDDPVFRDFVKEALDVFIGYELKDAEDGMQGALLVGTWQPDLVIVDLRMPNMNGVDFCRFLKKDDATADIKIIVASAYLSSEVRKGVNKLGVDSIIDKPVRLGTFVATVGKLSNMELK
jgi:excisionase family DNA binding protein